MRETMRVLTAPIIASALALPGAAHAQGVSLNYDALSSLEEPLAFELGEWTVNLTGVIDAHVAADIDGASLSDNEIDPGLVGNFEVSASTQLNNRWRVGAAYFGQYATNANLFLDNREDYSDNFAAFVGTSAGTVLGGNVSGLVAAQTKRRDGVGNGFMNFDNFYGGLDDWGGAYVGRFGPVVLTAAIDDDGHFEAGGFFQRPLGHKDYRFSLRVADATYVAQDLTTVFDTKGVVAVAEFVYGSSLFDLASGYERLESTITDVDRWFVAGGAQTKIGPLSLSAEGHFGKAAGDSEKAVALGAAYDLARGLSVNLGLNYEETEIVSGPVVLRTTDALQGLGSLRFSF